jgi:hypothetical protein
LIATLSSAAATAPAPTRFDPTQSDAPAIALADQVMDALGGRAAWDGTRYLRFAFDVVEAGKTVAHRVHLWDRYRGRLRYEKADKDGSSLVVLLAIDRRDGEVWRDGRRIEPEAAQPWLREAYEAWINDTYWLLMPYKMKDPGVHLRVAAPETVGGVTYDRILLTFDHVGLTPGDRYWASINRTTHRMDRWAYVLEDEPPGKAPSVWEWRGWARHGRILLASEKVALSEKGVKITHPILEAPDSLPDSLFESPGPVAGATIRHP